MITWMIYSVTQFNVLSGVWLFPFYALLLWVRFSWLRMLHTYTNIQLFNIYDFFTSHTFRTKSAAKWASRGKARREWGEGHIARIRGNAACLNREFQFTIIERWLTLGARRLVRLGHSSRALMAYFTFSFNWCGVCVHHGCIWHLIVFRCDASDV